MISIVKIHATSGVLNVAFIGVMYSITAWVFYLALTRQYAPDADLWLLRVVILALFAPVILKYILHFFIAPWYPAIEYIRNKSRSAEYIPSVSVLIPAKNEEVGIEKTIQSVIDSKYPNLEIIVINDGSTDQTHEVVNAFIVRMRVAEIKTNLEVKYILIPNSGKARALNSGLAMAQSEIIVTIDSDCIMDPDAIKNLVKFFDNSRVASVAGNVIIGNRSNPIGLIQQLEYLYGFYFKRADSLLNAVYIVGGAAAAYRREVVVKLGGFDENTITEDIELSTRLQYHGHLVRYAADAIVYTEGPSEVMGLCRQRLRWKFGRLQTFYKYRDLFFSLDRNHNIFLCFVIFPIAIFAEILLFFEGIMLTAFYGYTFITNDFFPLVLVILVLTVIICWQILVDTKTRSHINLIILAPAAWLLFYIMDCIEYQALIRSMWYLYKKEDPTWQPWKRVGVFEESKSQQHVTVGLS